jgi:YNFM family putative membrane transporter
MAYLSEEVEPLSLGHSIGLYIAGNALGGMSGRFLAAVIADHFGWRAAVLALGVLGVVGAIEFWRSLPDSRHFKPVPLNLAELRRDVGSHFADGGLPWLYVCAFLFMGCFVSLYNYLGFRLLAAPFNLSHSVLGFVFSLYMVGIWASAWVGRMADRFGRRNMLWLMVLLMAAGLASTLSDSLWLMVPGIALFTFGFFGGHSVASSWIGRRAAWQGAGVGLLPYRLLSGFQCGGLLLRLAVGYGQVERRGGDDCAGPADVAADCPEAAQAGAAGGLVFWPICT